MSENTSIKRDPKTLRSARWFGPDDLRSFGHRSRLKGMGWADEDFCDKPVVGILNTWSDLNTCHSHLRERAVKVKEGVWQAGGFPVEVPVMSLGEMLMKPTTMLYRNLLSMETEEVLRSHPIDAAVLMGGCDKTAPALLMGAVSADIPVIYLPCGPMLTARWGKETLGSGSSVWDFWAERCAGNLCDEDWAKFEDAIGRSPGHCMTMGTASTMSAIAEALGFTLPGASSIPAVVSEHFRMSTACGRRAVDLAWENLKPSDLLSRESFENAITVDMAVGGSTNAIIHIIAVARRAGFEVSLEDFDRISRATPVLANVRPNGEEYLMEDFYNAGGLRALMAQLGDKLHGDCATITGQTIAENISGAKVIDEEVIRTPDNPVQAEGGTFVLRGNLAPDGCVVKPSAASQELFTHRGRALVFDSYPDLKARLNDPDLEITKDTVLVLRSAGPEGGPGFPEWGMLPIPDKLLKEGVRDMVRLSDSRMSGTSYGMCVLHLSPESHVGGPLAFVQTGDEVELDVPNRKIQLHVSDEDLEKRRAAWQKPEPKYARGYGQLYINHVTQAHEGCDFDFLQHGSATPEPPIY
ncbi:MAG: L-arabinonate dehydratase [Verrucomicrobiota bacterium]|nr:L-arabinonate dehydratase [Verrucomicrobiota bacterium]